MTNLRVITAIEQPDQLDRADLVNSLAWPTFMQRTPVGSRYWTRLYEVFPALQFVLYDDDQEAIVAVGNSLALAWDGDARVLPDRGWDWAMHQAFADYEAGRPPRTQCALAIVVHPQQQGRGLSRRAVEAMRAVGAAQGLRRLIAPVRPSLKAHYPLVPMERYLRWQTSDGLPFDPWIRVHARLGAKIARICAESMHIPGSVVDWEQWTGMAFPDSDRYVVPGALDLVHIDRATDQGLYVEPNVWMVHNLQNTETDKMQRSL